jgi:general secretion pathway protein M
MIDKLTPQQQRWLAVGLLLFLLTVVAMLLLVPWYVKLSEYRDAVERSEPRLEAYTARIVDRSKAAASVEQIKRKIKEAGVFNTESTEALALAEMQQKIKDAVAEAEGNLMSTQVLAQQQTEGLTKILVKVRFAGRVETLEKVLYTLETATPYMLVENLQVTSVRGMRNPTTRKVDPVDKVNVMMDVSSFMQAGQK